MEKTIEDKIRRAEEIYARRQGEEISKQTCKEQRKDIKILKKLLIQVMVCLIIYFIISVIQNSNYIFSEDFLNKASEILSYDINFSESFDNIKDQIMGIFNQDSKEKNSMQGENTSQMESIGGAIETVEGGQEEINQDTSQTSQDILTAKNTTSFIKPIEGEITSEYGARESSNPRVTKNHTGIDIAAPVGTKIKAATSGEVVLNSSKGDYREPFENSNW